jgi:hypothetical protein
MKVHPPTGEEVNSRTTGLRSRLGSRSAARPTPPSGGIEVAVVRPRASGIPAAEVLAVALLALVVRLIHLDHAPYIDELNHVLAARSVLHDGTLQINGGIAYTRSWGFTLLVTGMVALFGDSLVVGRIPAVTAGVALVVAVFIWVRSLSNVWGAWFAALLVCFAPISIYLSQQVRFYTFQALFFWIGAVAVYAATADGPRRKRARLGLAAVALTCFALALHLQPVSIVGIAAVALWVVLDRTPATFRWLRRPTAPRPAVVAVVVLAAVVALGLLATSNPVAQGVRFLSYADAWAAHSRDYVWFYHDIYVEQYATLWTLFPVLLLVAASRYPRPTFFAAVVFTFAFLFHSTAAWKHERYLFYALPFFFTIAGLAIAVLVPWARSRFDLVWARSGASGPAALRTAVFSLGLSAAALFAAFGNGASIYTLRMLTSTDADWALGRAYRGEADWAMATPQLRAAASDADLVITSAKLKALYYLNRLDMGLTVNALTGRHPLTEFAVVRKEAVPTISTPESLQLVESCYRSGLVIVEDRNWRQAWGVTAAVADHLESALEQVPVPARSGVLAFRWNNPRAEFHAGCEITRGQGWWRSSDE